MDFVGDMEYDLMGYCLDVEGKWWATHLFRNKEVNELYRYIRGQDLDLCIELLYRYYKR